MLVRGSKVSPWLSFFVITPIQMQERRFSAIMGTGLLKRGERICRYCLLMSQPSIIKPIGYWCLKRTCVSVSAVEAFLLAPVLYSCT